MEKSHSQPLLPSSPNLTKLLRYPGCSSANTTRLPGIVSDRAGHKLSHCSPEAPLVSGN